MPYAIYLAPPLIQLSCLGIKMKAHHEEGSLEWRVGYVLDDFASFTSAILISFVGVPSMLLTAMIPKVKDDDTSSQ